MKAKKIIAVIISLSIMSAAITGCTGSSNASSNTDNVESVQVTASSDMFTSRDMEVGYDESECVKINLSDNASSCDDKNVNIDGNTIKITKEGKYILTGKLTDGQIIVETDKKEKVQLILDNAEISNSSSAPIYVKSSDKVFITTAEDSNNVLAVNGEFKEDSENKVDSAIFSKSDLTLNGRGTLQVNDNYGNGITSKDNLVLTSGSYNINASNHGLEGKDSIRIANGNYTIVSGNDAIHGDNDEDETLGYVYIENGNIDISAQDDGIHSSSAMTINGGNINISKSYEGIEGKTIDINGGEIKLTASDDGINAASGKNSSNEALEKQPPQMGEKPEMDPNADEMKIGKGGGPGLEAQEGVYIKITGGKIYLNASGDGIDSNGSLTVTGGETYVSGPSSNKDAALDYDGEAQITSGIFVAAGASGMAQNFGDSSTQCSMLVQSSSMQTGSVIVKDSSGKELLNYTPQNSYNSAVISMPDLTKKETYTVSLGDETQTITMDNLIYGNKANQPGKMGMRQKGDKNPNMKMTGDK